MKWHAIAASLDLSTDATLTETRVIVEGKLTELGHELVGVQAILSDIDKSLLYLVDEGGIIKTVNMSAHVSSDDSRDHVMIMIKVPVKAQPVYHISTQYYN